MTKLRNILAIAGSVLIPAAAHAAAPSHASFRARQPEEEVIYFLLPDRFENGDPSNDRGGLAGDRLRTVTFRAAAPSR